jgi:hypothetical protein
VAGRLFESFPDSAGFTVLKDQRFRNNGGVIFDLAMGYASRFQHAVQAVAHRAGHLTVLVVDKGKMVGMGGDDLAADIFNPDIKRTAAHIVNGHFGGAVAAVLTEVDIALFTRSLPGGPLPFLGGAQFPFLLGFFLLGQPCLVVGYLF